MTQSFNPQQDRHDARYAPPAREAQPARPAAPAQRERPAVTANVPPSPDRTARGPHFVTTAPSGLFGDANLPRVSVVIPAKNEERNLAYVLPAIPDWVHEVVLVDGRSTDRSVAVARELRPDIRVVTQHGRGKGDALRAGFAVAEGDIIVMLDADGSTDPREMPAFVGALLAGAEFAKGSRFMQGGGSADMTPIRRMGNDALTMLVRLLFGCQYSDLCYGYNAFWSHVLPRLALDADGFEIETLMNLRALRANLRVVEVHSFEAERIYGESNLRAIPDGWRVLKTIVRERLGIGGPRPRARRRPQQQPALRGLNDLLADISRLFGDVVMDE